MAPSQTAPTTRQEFITLIKSLTTQLEHAEATTAKLEETITRLRSKEEESANERERLLSQIMQETSQRMDLERELALTRQGLTNSQREAKQHQDTLALTDRINTSSLTQARREAQDWKEQCARSEAVRESQGQQIDDLLGTIKEFMSRQNSYIPFNSTLRHVGPLISAPIPMSTPRVKQEDIVGSSRLNIEMDKEEENSVDEDEPVYKSTNKRKKRRPEPKNRITESDENQSMSGSQSNDEGSEDEDDEMALGYEERRSTLPAESSTAETSHVSQRSVHRRQSTRAHNASPQKHGTSYLAPEVLLKTPSRSATQRRNGHGSASAGRDGPHNNSSVKKRRIGPASVLSRGEVGDIRKR